ncbi:NUDIX hydrolase [Microbacterium oxydans]|uniref:NUDIX hydrolase n=1 Tax=Microbacterium oxydans TaxID=82380 RepID=UPI0024AD4FDF|nr:NUDIX hydrolase [Microbacterium oxydans]
MRAEDESIIHVTPNASWLPPGSRAEVLRLAIPPQPLCAVRLLLRRGDRVFCVPRSGTGRLDLPTCFVGADDPAGAATVATLAQEITAETSPLTFVGVVRNVVESPTSDYPWPTPHAHFGLWSSEGAPIIEGSWVTVGGDSPLRARHWYPLVADPG